MPAKYLKLGYQYMVNYLFAVLLLPVMVVALAEVARLGPYELLHLWRRHRLHVLGCSIATSLLLHFWRRARAPPVYVVDFACCRPPSELRVPYAAFYEHLHMVPFLDERSTRFLVRIMERSGIGEETCIPSSAHTVPFSSSLDESHAEAELVIFPAVDDLVRKTGINPCEIDILVLNCTVFNPNPSLSAKVINRYKLRDDVRCFNLGGMGCSAGIIAVDLARTLLQVNPNSTALVVSTEILTTNQYSGNELSMILPACLFRMGSAAVLLSNRRAHCDRAKYRYLHVVRTNMAADDRAYRCIHQQEDKDGKCGFNLTKDLLVVAGEALKANITTLAPLVLPLSEQLLFAFSFIGRKIFNRSWKPYVPDFKQAFQHFCIHAGGRAVIDELEKGLQLSAEHVEASRMTLHRFGNTSSSSLWYELAYIEAKGRMRRGDRVWMIGFGSGFKCNSAAWECIRNIDATTEEEPWCSCIQRYPVAIPDVLVI